MASADLAPAPVLARAIEFGKAVARGSVSWWVAVLMLILLSLVLRVYAIDHDSLWYDEAVISSSTQIPTLDWITGRAYDSGNPPLYWILAGIWSAVFGTTEAGLRSLPALTGVLTVPFLALVGRRLISPRVGLLGASLLAVSPTAIELSNEARPYSLLGLLAVMASWFFVRWVQENRGCDIAFYSVAIFLTCATHYYGCAVPLAHAIGLAVLPREGRRLRSWLIAMVVAALLGLPVLRILISQLGIRGNLGRMSDAWMTQFLATPMVFGLGRSLAWRESPAWVLGAVTLAAVACFWAPAIFALSRWRRNAFAVVLLGSWSLIPIAGPLAVALTLSPIYATRYAFVGLPPFLLLTAWGLEQLRPWVRWMSIVAILVMTSLSFYCYATRPLKDDWRTETRFVVEQLKPGELVAFQPDQEIATFLYYLPRYGAPPRVMIGLGPSPRGNERVAGVRYLDGLRADRYPRDCTDSLASSSGVWLVRCAPGESVELYRTYLARRGLELVGQRRSHRIEIFHFTRQTESVQSGGRVES
jgi:mannosyltransferase